MKYLGGKSRTCKAIAGLINITLETGQAYYEPFCGGCWVTQYVVAPRRYASDLRYELICLWQAVQDGWIPPDAVGEAEYYATLHDGLHDDEPHLKGFILQACAFGGHYGTGYARAGKRGARNFALVGKRGIAAKMRRLRDVHFFHANALTVEPPEPNMLIYCDPPYAGTTQYNGLDRFDHVRFWERVRQWARVGHTVLISEYSAPDDFSCVWEQQINLHVRSVNGNEPRLERLFRYGAYRPYQLRLFE